MLLSTGGTDVVFGTEVVEVGLGGFIGGNSFSCNLDLSSSRSSLAFFNSYNSRSFNLLSRSFSSCSFNLLLLSLSESLESVPRELDPSFALNFSKENPVIFSTYAKSSLDSLSAATAILTPLALCKWIFPLAHPMNSASTLKVPLLSTHRRDFFGLGKSLVAEEFFL